MNRHAIRSAFSAALLIAAGAASAQQPQSAIVPDSITVGDVFHAAIRVPLPADARLVAPDSLLLGEDLETAGRREIRRDTTTQQTTLIYPMTAWRPGSYDLPQITLQVVSDGAASTIDVSLPSFTVRSVLPPDTAGIEPKPAKDVLGANRVWWPILLALLIALLIAIGLIVWWRRRRKPEPVEFIPGVPPRERALAQLNALSREGYLERSDYRGYYERLTAIMRRYAEAVQPAWSVDLTTTELASRLSCDMDPVHALELIRILGAADLVKFARATTTRDSAARDLDVARRWIDRVTPAPAPADDDQRRAA